MVGSFRGWRLWGNGPSHAETRAKLGAVGAGPGTRQGCTADGINEAGKDRKEPFAQLTMARSCIYSSKCTKVKLSSLDPALALLLVRMQ